MEFLYYYSISIVVTWLVMVGAVNFTKQPPTIAFTIIMLIPIINLSASILLIFVCILTYVTDSKITKDDIIKKIFLYKED